jgi:hypothetical protein
MSYTTNYAQRSINEVIQNFSFFSDNSSVNKSESFHLNLEIGVNIESLILQSKTFSSNFRTHGYINFYKTLRIRENEVSTKLEEIYIYDFVKCLYNGLFFHRISENSNLGYAFRGHSALFHLLKSQGNNGRCGSTMLSFILNQGSDLNKYTLFLQLLNQFKFLNKYRNYTTNSFGTHPFFIQEYEMYLNCFAQDHYSMSNIQQGNTDNLADNSKSDSIYANGQLHLVLMNEVSDSSTLSFSNTPLMNSFISHDGGAFYFARVNSGKSISDNPSVFFSKANFIKLTKDNNDMRSIDRIYNRVKINNDIKHTVCSEVFTITGIKCRYVSSPFEGSIKTYLKSDFIKDKISNLINNYNLNFDKIIESIFEDNKNILEIDIDESLDKLIEKLVK